jgi:hypothetical protein
MNVIALTLNWDGKLMEFRQISTADIKKCPSFILLPSHYRDDGSCRHDEPICEEDGCTNLKYDEEIFCKKHVDEMDGIFEG